MHPRRLVPNENTRARHAVRATVIEHTNHATGRWFWKQSFPSLKLRFSDDEHRKLRQIVESVPTGDMGPMPMPPREVKVGMATVAECNEYEIGEEVIVKFSTSNGIEAFFFGAALFRWDGIEKVAAQVEASLPPLTSS